MIEVLVGAKCAWKDRETYTASRKAQGALVIDDVAYECPSGSDQTVRHRAYHIISLICRALLNGQPVVINTSQTNTVSGRILYVGLAAALGRQSVAVVFPSDVLLDFVWEPPTVDEGFSIVVSPEIMTIILENGDEDGSE